MIKDIPNSIEYQNVGTECLLQAYDNICNVDNALSPETPREKIWNYNQIVLRTSLVLIHQGIEGLLKSEICKKSSLLLIDRKRSDWKTLPNSGDESFSDFNTIGGDDLLKTFYACINLKDIHDDFPTHYEDIRIKRNKIVHGLGTENLNPEYVLKLILNSFTYLLGKDSFWDSVLNKFYEHPGFEHEDSHVEWQDSNQYMRMEYLNAFLGKGELKKHFSVNITAREYLCPFCIEKAEEITEEGIIRPDSKWAFLSPNEPNSTDMSCIICRTDFGVIRENCIKEDCKGNVKYLLEDDEDEETWACLTCWNEELKKV
ncbi:MAG: hypothetical protein ABIP27_10995 [Flavobacterium circumlabens]|uniref:hypothetical protein n=1 Tax=Flavobacterium circumlabens TaxID=2133765 RepID=UPI003265416D